MTKHRLTKTKTKGPTRLTDNLDGNQITRDPSSIREASIARVIQYKIAEIDFEAQHGPVRIYTKEEIDEINRKRDAK